MISLFGNGIVYVSLILTVLFYVKLLKKLIPSEVLSLRIIYFINLLPFILLIYAFSISDFTLLNVIENSYIDDPLFYKVTSAWGSHEGSILLWVFLINLFGIFCLSSSEPCKHDVIKNSHPKRKHTILPDLIFIKHLHTEQFPSNFL